MNVYKVASNAKAVVPRADGVDAMIIVATDADEASAVAQGLRGQETRAVWTAAQAAPLLLPDTLAFSDISGWGFRLQITTSPAIDLVVTAKSGESFDSVMTRLNDEIKLQNFADGPFDAPYYDPDEPALNIDQGETFVGDSAVTFSVIPPSTFPSAYSFNSNRLIGSIEQLGIDSSVLAIHFNANVRTAFPSIVAGYKQ